MKSGQGHWKSIESSDRGNEYQGKYKNDKKHGFGEYTWVSGSRYRG